jgi:hypothetical protein
MNNKLTSFLIKFPYWLGIGADALWAIALFYYPIYGRLTGNLDFVPDLQFRLTMSIGGILMTGWTLLLVWGVRNPIERRFIILLTAFPVVFGLFLVSLVAYTSGNSTSLWIVFKTVLLFVIMVNSYYLAGKISKNNNFV